MKSIILSFCCFMALAAAGQRKDLIKYMNSCNRTGSEESQEIAPEYSFEQGCKFSILAYTYLSGVYFRTDTAAINGFKAIVSCAFRKQDRKMMAIMYFDKTKKHWSVVSMQPLTNVAHEYQTLRSEVDSGKFYKAAKYTYKDLAWWALLSGHVLEAKKYIDKSVSIAKNNNESQAEFEAIRLIITRIL